MTTQTLTTTTEVPGAKSATGKQIVKPQVSYPQFKTREQFWWPPSGVAPAPTLENMAPNTAKAGGSDLRLYVYGSGFTSNSQIVFNGNAEPTEMLSSNILATGVRPSLFVVPADVPVLVRTGAVDSNTVIFKFT